MSNAVKITQLSSGSGVCSLLQLDDINILLDCGCSAASPDIDTIRQKISEVGSIDFVLITHADMQHVGALPHVFGCKNLAAVPLICTIPVLKMSQMTLYDAYLNGSMLQTSDDLNFFTLDDVDHCFRNAVTVKYSQVSRREHQDGPAGEIFVCAYPAGRTIGGASWSIRYGSTEVVYVMDVNLRRELLLDGGSLELPQSPSLLVIGGAVNERSTSNGATHKRKKDRGDDGLIANIIDTVRSDGNVLIPCESAGRTLELLLTLNKFWGENNLAMYHLVYLSPMACNTIEFARCQLEWMSDLLCQDFYMGKNNPLSLSSVKVLPSLRELDMLSPGPRVVLTTDASFSCGLSRQLLLRWGGDPKSRVLFTDISESHTLASELRSQKPPVIATVTRSERVPLLGAELEAYEKAENIRRRNMETASQRRRRERELTDLASLGTAEPSDISAMRAEVDEEPTAEQEHVIGMMHNEADETFNFESGAHGELNEFNKRLISSYKNESDQIQSDVNGARNDNIVSTISGPVVRRGRITRFAQPRFRMFETRDLYTAYSEYGHSLEEFNLRHVPPSAVRSSELASLSAVGPRSVGFGGMEIDDRARGNSSSVQEGSDPDLENISATPMKVVWKKTLVQFTCCFKEANVGGRADTRAMRTLVKKLRPQRVVILQGAGNMILEERKSIAKDILESGTEAWAPEPKEIISFMSTTRKVKLLIPQALSSSSAVVRQGPNRKSLNSKCAAVILPEDADFLEVKSKSSDGIRVAKVAAKTLDSSSCCSIIRGDPDFSLGAISVDEILLDTLRQQLEAAGVGVEYKLGIKGGMLLCENAVVIRRENDNDFIIEGCPGPALNAARRALYECYTFL